MTSTALPPQTRPSRWRGEISHRSATTAAGVLVFVVTLGSALALATSQPVATDETLFADPSRSAAAGEGFGSPLMSGLLPGAEDRSLWQPPGYTAALAGWFKLFGFSLAAGRVFSAGGLAMALLAVFLIARCWVPASRAALVCAFALFTPWVLAAGATLRPDSWCAAAVAWTLFAYLAWLDGRRERWLLAAGLTSAVAVLIHPIGAIAAATLVVHAVLLDRDRPWRPVATYVLTVAALVAVPWGVYVAGHWDDFVGQMGLQLGRKHKFDPLWVLRGQDWNLLAYVPIVLVIATAVRRWRYLGGASTVAAAWLVVTGVAVYAGREQWYTLYLVLAVAPVFAWVLSAVSRRHVAALTAIAGMSSAFVVASFSVAANRAGSTADSIVAMTAKMPAKGQVLLGRGAGAIYFGIDDPSRVRSYSPVPIPSGRLARVAEEQGMVASAPPPTDIPEMDALLTFRGDLIVSPSPVGIWRVTE